VRRLAAAALESAGRPLDALTVHRAEPPSVSRTNAIRGLVLRRGRDMTESDGAAATAAVLLDIGVGGDPALETTLGEALQVSGDWDGAIQAYERAATGSDSLPARLTWRWGSLLYFRGELADAARVLERTAPGGDAGDHALVLAWTASVHWARGDVARASDAAEQALKRAEEAGVASAMAAAHVARALVAASTGDRDTNLREYERALAHAVEARETLLITRVEANLSSKYLEEADYAKAVEHAEAALRVGVGIPPLAALAESNRAEALLRLGRLEESMASIQRSRDMYTAAKSLNTQRPLTLLGDLCRERGDLAGARSAYLEARALAQRSGDAHALAPILAGLARLSAAEDPEEARRLADEASRRADARYRPMAAVTLGWVALTARDVVAARHFAAASEAAALDTRDQAGRAEALELAGACHPDSAEEHLSEAIAIWAAIKSPIGEARCRLARAVLQPKLWAAEESAARGTLVHLGVRMQPAAAGLLAVISEPDRGIRINTLGGFRVVRDGSVIRSAEWGSRKATTLLKLLLAHQGRPVSRAAIAEVIWPDADQRQMARRISELVSSLRTAFDPTRRHREDHYIISDARAVTLDIEHVELDVAELLASAREGLRAVDEHDWTQALAQLERAESLCGGEFLEEDAYEPWTAECREQVRVAATNVSRALAQLAEQRSNNESACRHLRRVLERDPHDEEAWLLLIAALVRMRRHGEARRAYATYTTRMREIGVAPAPFDRYGESTAKSVHSPGTPRN
jgi:DNA-binding SARP family transcriptional activator